MQKRLFIISNRMPVAVEIDAHGRPELRPSSGGLVSAISNYLSQPGHMPFSTVYWAGVPNVTEKLWLQSLQDQEPGEYTYLPVFIGRKTYDAYYNGFSNSVLWPLFHYFPSFVECHASFFNAYLHVNQQFADHLAAQVQKGDVVWIHDYHLLPLAAMLRERCPEVTIGFFLHIPFPSHELLRIIPRPWQRALLEGMLGADLIGFHTADYADHFLHAAQTILGIEHDGTVINWKQRKIKAGVFPISVDFSRFHDAYALESVADYRKQYQQIASDRKLIFSVDRLDYTKGILNRLRGYKQFLVQHPEFREKVVFAMVLVPSRDTIMKYSDRKKSIDEFIGSLNSKLGNIGWQPVLYQYGHLSFDELVGLYTACDLALITPLRDGMNLVAKEFVASRADNQGVLVLSEMAGACHELPEALVINPNDEQEMADMIFKGLHMSAGEQSQRMLRMQDRIREYDVRAWAEDYFQQLTEMHDLQPRAEEKRLTPGRSLQLRNAFAQAENRLLLLDYDGTLVNFTARPSDACPGPAVLALVRSLASAPGTEVYIISGRDAEALGTWFADIPVGLVAEHGAMIRPPGENWQAYLPSELQWKKNALRIFDRFTKRCPETFVEQKAFSLAWHYRMVPPAEAATHVWELVTELTGFAAANSLEVLRGNKVVELRADNINKGIATRRVLEGAGFDFVLAIGDDLTDEDMFGELEGVPGAFTVKVGADASRARFNLPDTTGVLSLLGSLSEAAVGVPAE